MTEKEKNEGFVLLEVFQNKAGAESQRSFQSSREVMYLYFWTDTPEMIGKNSRKNLLH